VKRCGLIKVALLLYFALCLTSYLAGMYFEAQIGRPGLSPQEVQRAYWFSALFLRASIGGFMIGSVAVGAVMIVHHRNRAAERRQRGFDVIQ
jgi:hypothetical protein